MHGAAAKMAFPNRFSLCGRKFQKVTTCCSWLDYHSKVIANGSILCFPMTISKSCIYRAPTILLQVFITPLPAPTPPVPPVFCGQLALTKFAAGPSLITGAGTQSPVLSSQQTVAFGAYTASLQKSCRVLRSGGTGTDVGILGKTERVVSV